VEQQAIVDAAAGLGVALSAPQVGLLLEHLDLLARWNRRHNLVGPGDPALWLERHTLDSLAAAARLPAGKGLDVGSGAGFPGIPLAIARADCSFVLLEPRQKRAAFLRTVVAKLALGNVTVDERGLGVAEPQGNFDFALSRATWPAAEWLKRGAAFVRPPGLVFAYLAAKADVSPDLVAVAGLRELKRLPYRIGAQPHRQLGIFERARERST
jgi:16S rRNA (guanine527-N7)-methyltransferase